MNTVKFDQMPTDVEKTCVDDINNDSVKHAWDAYEMKPEYKEFNKHDLIESMLDKPIILDQSPANKK